MFDGKLKKRIAELEELVAFNETLIDGLTQEQNRLATQKMNDASLHKSDRAQWEQVLAMKERAWELERMRLKGLAEAYAEKADLYDTIIKPYAWEWNGTVDSAGRKVDALMARRDDPHQSWRIPYPEGKRP